MAIEFQCPYCTAMIRVGDEAAGKRGKCPKCETTLMVPRPEAPGDVPGPVDGIDQSADDEIVIPELAPEIQIGPQASVTSRVRRRRMKQGGLLFPLVCGGLLLLAITAVWFLNDPSRFRGSLTGELTAMIAEPESLEPRTIDGELVSGAADTFTDLVESLAERPGRIRSNTMLVTFGAADGRVSVRVEPGSGFRLVRVSLAAAPGLREFVASESSRLDRLRRKDLATHLEKLLAEWQTARDNDEPFDRWPSYRDTLGLATMVGGVGHHAIAVTGRQELRCLFEGDGALYFLVPVKLNRFQLTGRRRSDGSVPFPAEYQVRVVAADGRDP